MRDPPAELLPHVLQACMYITNCYAPTHDNKTHIAYDHTTHQIDGFIGNSSSFYKNEVG